MRLSTENTNSFPTYTKKCPVGIIDQSFFTCRDLLPSTLNYMDRQKLLTRSFTPDLLLFDVAELERRNIEEVFGVSDDVDVEEDDPNNPQNPIIKLNQSLNDLFDEKRDKENKRDHGVNEATTKGSSSQDQVFKLLKEYGLTNPEQSFFMPLCEWDHRCWAIVKMRNVMFLLTTGGKQSYGLMVYTYLKDQWHFTYRTRVGRNHIALEQVLPFELTAIFSDITVMPDKKSNPGRVLELALWQQIRTKWVSLMQQQDQSSYDQLIQALSALDNIMQQIFDPKGQNLTSFYYSLTKHTATETLVNYLVIQATQTQANDCQKAIKTKLGKQNPATKFAQCLIVSITQGSNKWLIWQEDGGQLQLAFEGCPRLKASLQHIIDNNQQPNKFRQLTKRFDIDNQEEDIAKLTTFITSVGTAIPTAEQTQSNQPTSSSFGQNDQHQSEQSQNDYENNGTSTARRSSLNLDQDLIEELQTKISYFERHQYVDAKNAAQNVYNALTELKQQQNGSRQDQTQAQALKKARKSINEAKNSALAEHRNNGEWFLQRLMQGITWLLQSFTCGHAKQIFKFDRDLYRKTDSITKIQQIDNQLPELSSSHE